MKKKTVIKILTGVSVGLAVCVAGLLVVSAKSPESPVQASTMVVENVAPRSAVVALASQSIAIPVKSAKNLGLYSQYSTKSVASNTTEAYVEEYTDEFIEEITDEYTEPLVEEVTEDYYEEPVTEDYDDGWDDGGDDWDDGGDDWDDPWYGSSIPATAAAIAEAHVGITPYIPACHSLDGADCSGFTYACYAAAGYYDLSFSDSGQACQGRSVMNEEWLPGDIVVYYGHVGIYVGGGCIVHCPDIGRYAEYANVHYTKVLDVRRILE